MLASLTQSAQLLQYQECSQLIPSQCVAPFLSLEQGQQLQGQTHEVMHICRAATVQRCCAHALHRVQEMSDKVM